VYNTEEVLESQGFKQENTNRQIRVGIRSLRKKETRRHGEILMRSTDTNLVEREETWRRAIHNTVK
jgi:hypothetical protein